MCYYILGKDAGSGFRKETTNEEIGVLWHSDLPTPATISCLISRKVPELSEPEVRLVSSRHVCQRTRDSLDVRDAMVGHEK